MRIGQDSKKEPPKVESFRKKKLPDLTKRTLVKTVFQFIGKRMQPPSFLILRQKMTKNKNKSGISQKTICFHIKDISKQYSVKSEKFQKTYKNRSCYC